MVSLNSHIIMIMGYVLRKIIVKLNGLRIPPAWTDVEINLSKSVNRMVVGIDNDGRKQSIYNQKYVLRKERMCNIADLIVVLPEIRRMINTDIKARSRRTRAIATIVKMMDTCCPLRIEMIYIDADTIHMDYLR